MIYEGKKFECTEFIEHMDLIPDASKSQNDTFLSISLDID